MTNSTEETVAEESGTTTPNGADIVSEPLSESEDDSAAPESEALDPAGSDADSSDEAAEAAAVEVADSANEEAGEEPDTTSVDAEPAEEEPANDLPADAEPAEETAAVEVAPEPEKVKSPYDRPGRWYVLHTQSGYENKVKTNLVARTQSMNMESRIFEVVIPLEDVVEFKNGKKVVVQKKVFPGYLLCRLHLDDDSWFVVRNTPGVTGFAGAGNTPVPMRRSEVEQHLGVKDEAEEAGRKGRPRLEYGMGETVRVKEGPFADFQGEIVEINEDQLKVKVLVNIFGRETPVELEFAQVGKV